ncbi:MAG: phosphopantetheine-binding protein [Pseudomonadota bacterium]|nr:phosphopantetheine-binding protein [Pseudomonadota bacterium]
MRDADTHLERRRALLELVRTVLVEDLRIRLDRESIDPDLSLFGTGLGLDSVDTVDLVTHLERRTGVRVPDDAQGRVWLRSVNTLVDLLEQHEGALGPR